MKISPKKRATKRPALDAFGRDSFALLKRLRLEFLVIGGLAVIARGEPRTTADVDVLVFGSDADLVRLLDAALGAGFTADRDTELEALRTTGTLRLRRGPHQLDVIVASLPFEREALGRAPRERLFGRLVAIPTAEDLLVFKVLAGRDKDLVDATGIARRHLPDLDLDYAERLIREVGEFAEDPSLVARLAAIVRKAR